MDRNVQELLGIRWYLQTYLAGDVQIQYSTNATNAATMMHLFQPDVLIINIDLLPDRQDVAIYTLLQHGHCHVFGMTAEPVFQTAIKAIALHAKDLFMKPVDLEQLKRQLTLLKKPQPSPVKNDSFYMQLFLGTQTTDSIFILIEPEHTSCIQQLYEWLSTSILFKHVKVYPFSKWLVCLFPPGNVEKDVKVLQKEWHQQTHISLNISVYDEVKATLAACYRAAQKALEQCFYKGFGHIFYTSQQLEPVSFDPLLSPEQQRSIINSLEQLDIESFHQFLYPIQKGFYDQEDVRVHLTSILAQVRRFMLKHKLQQIASFEQQYRQLFRFIMEHPILYTIINEITFFTETLIQEVQQQKINAPVHVVFLAKEIIEQQYANSSLTLTKAAKELGISSNYLSTLFAQEEKIPFKKYLQLYRLEKAAQLLLTSDATIAEIAHATGFEDPNYFSKIFKQQKGSSPRKYKLFSIHTE